MGGSRGFRLKGGINDSLDALGGDRDTTATAWSDMGESVDATFLKASAPQDYGGACYSQLRRDTVIGGTFGGQQDNPCPKGNTLRSIWGLVPCFNGSTLFIGHRERRSCIPHANNHTS
jgi:hypothetical protein